MRTPVELRTSSGPSNLPPRIHWLWLAALSAQRIRLVRGVRREHQDRCNDGPAPHPTRGYQGCGFGTDRESARWPARRWSPT